MPFGEGCLTNAMCRSRSKDLVSSDCEKVQCARRKCATKQHGSEQHRRSDAFTDRNPSFWQQIVYFTKARCTGIKFSSPRGQRRDGARRQTFTAGVPTQHSNTITNCQTPKFAEWQWRPSKIEVSSSPHPL